MSDDTTDHGSEDSTEPIDSTRRRYMQVAGGIVTAGMTGAALSGSATAANSPPPTAFDQFRVQGREKIQTRIRPNEIIVHRQKQSEDLARRYGLTPPIIETTDRMKRPESEDDGLPERETLTEIRPWDSYYAKEDEWKDAFVDVRASGIAVGESIEEDYASAVWQFNEVDGGYETNAPINMVSTDSVPEILDVLDDNGWSTGWIAEYDRWAWNSEENEFQTQHNSAGSSRFRTLGGEHIRMWEFGGWTSIQAHVDSSAPHEAIAYLEAEREIEEFFDQATGWWGHRDEYDFPHEDAGLDHNGEVTLLNNL